MWNLSFRTKMGLVFGALLVITATTGLTDYFSAVQLSRVSRRVQANVTKAHETLSVARALEQQSDAVRAFVITGNENQLKDLDAAESRFRDSARTLDQLLTLDGEKDIWSRLKQQSDRFRSETTRSVDLTRRGKTKEAAHQLFTRENVKLREELRESIDELLSFEDKLKQDSTGEQSALESRIQFATLILCSLGLVIGSIWSVLMTRAITRNVSRMMSMIQEIAANNLAVEDMAITGRDEVGTAAAALNAMKNNLRAMIHSIASTAEHVAAASEEISSSAVQQAQSAETQKGQTAQISAAMQEMSSSVQQVSENANASAEAARRAAETARSAGAIADQTLTKMHAIAGSVSATAHKIENLGKSSDQIGRIVNVINDIADQTNLLALNAAIEAARAGEQGRGFAVVADEVRKLAERTTKATKEIAAMIENIQEETRTAVGAMEEGTLHVEEGVKTTAQAGEALKQIIQMAEEVREMVTHIAAATAQQSTTSDQVNNSMEQISRLVTESAVGAQESAKACQDLSELALDLQRMVGNFKLGRLQPHAAGSESAKSSGAAAG